MVLTEVTEAERDLYWTERKAMYKYGPWFQPFGKYGKVYCNPSSTKEGENDAYRRSYMGWYGDIFLLIGIASYSLWDLLIVPSMAIAHIEAAQHAWKEAWYFPYGVGPGGFGDSDFRGWLAGYLIAPMMFKDWNYWSLAGAYCLLMYIKEWTDGLHRNHKAHFVTVAEGFGLGLVLRKYGPKRRPVKFLTKFLGGFLPFVVGAGYFLFEMYLKKQYPDPPGFDFWG